MSLKDHRLEPLGRAPLPPFPGWLKALGPGVVWMALAQGSGELIFWPYLVAKYGLAFLFLLVPACLLQWPLTFEIGRYTALTGESIWQGFIRVHPLYALPLWVLMILSFLWFGAYASAGGTALAALTNFPARLVGGRRGRCCGPTSPSPCSWAAWCWRRCCTGSSSGSCWWWRCSPWWA